MTSSRSRGQHRGPPGWPVRVFQLGQDADEDLTESTTPEERLAMVWELTARAWKLTGASLPTYRRSEIPVRVLRPT